MKTRLLPWIFLEMFLLALACGGCREKSSHGPTPPEGQNAGGQERSPASWSHTRKANDDSRARHKQNRADFARTRSRFLELWNLDGNGPMSGENSGAIRDLLQQEIPKWNQGQLKAVLDELMAGDLSDPGRVSELDAMLSIYAEMDPADTLKLYDQLIAAAPSFDGNVPFQVVLSAADQDPLSAAQWLSNQKAMASTPEGKVMMQKIVRKAAAQNPALVVNILNGQNGVDSQGIAKELADSALSRDQKIQLLDEFRNHIDDPAADNLRSLRPVLLEKFGASFSGSSVEETRKWVESAHLSQDEIHSFAKGYKASRKPGEAEQLSDWLRQTKSTTYTESP